jgi:membrane-anchored protein YejM (alkaline phosphatase superfamily)
VTGSIVISLALVLAATGVTYPADDFKPADSVAAAFLNWQQSVSDRAFFAFLNFYDAHAPYRAPDSFVRRFVRDPSSKVEAYDAAIAWLDHVVGSILDSLRQREILEQTVVIVSADHGESFGEHGLDGHRNSLTCQRCTFL